MAMSVTGENVKNGVTWRVPGDFSTLNHNFLHDDSGLKFSNWRNMKDNDDILCVPGPLY